MALVMSPQSTPVGLQGRLLLQKLAVRLHPRTWRGFGRQVDFLLINLAMFFLTFSPSDST